MLLTCPRWAKGRSSWLRLTRSTDMASLLSDKDHLQRITSWINREMFLGQFALGPDLENLIQDRREKKGKKEEGGTGLPKVRT